MFSIKLKLLREKAGYSQQKFADAFGVAQSTVAGWESGKREPTIETLNRLSVFFGISVDELLDFSPLLATPYMQALRRYCSIMKNTYGEDRFVSILEYYEQNPAFADARKRGLPLRQIEAKDIRDILGLDVNVAVALGCSLCQTPDEYSKLYIENEDLLLCIGRSVSTGGTSSAKAQPTNAIRIAGRDGSLVERQLTDEQLALFQSMLDQMKPIDDESI